MSIWEEGFWLRHQDRWFVETVREFFGISAAVQEVTMHGKRQYRLKIIRDETVEYITSILRFHGWTPRNAPERPYPSGSLNDRGFCRAWVELHSAVDVRMAKHRNGQYYPQKRLRIYGNWALLEEMNYIISSAVGLNPRTLQKTSNETTKALYFHGRSVTPVVTWLYDGAGIWNPLVRTRLEG